MISDFRSDPVNPYLIEPLLVPMIADTRTAKKGIRQLQYPVNPYLMKPLLVLGIADTRTAKTGIRQFNIRSIPT